MLELEKTEQSRAEIKVTCGNLYCRLLLLARLKNIIQSKDAEDQDGDEMKGEAEEGAAENAVPPPLPTPEVLERIVDDDSLRKFLRNEKHVAAAALCNLEERQEHTVAAIDGLKPGLEYTIYAYLLCTVDEGEFVSPPPPSSSPSRS
jgi:hypothetical protein